MTSRLHSDLNWNLLRMFYVIAKEQSITKAAKSLGLSQPSVSSALQKLETQLDCQLVIRDSRHFNLTARGDRIYQECRDIFQSAERISSLVNDIDEQERGQVRYQIISDLVSPLLDELMRLYHQRYPSVAFQSEVRNSQAIVRAIQQDKATIGFCLLVDPLVNLPSIRLFRREFGLFCGQTHPLFGASSVPLEELQREPLISFACATDGPDLEPVSILREGLHLSNRINGLSTNLEEVRRMLVAGLGIGILPLLSAEEDIRRGLLWRLDIANEPIGADVYLVHAPNEKLSPPEKKFVDMAEELQSRDPEFA
ncbi:MAG: LysR family transcriptional regulator [Marinovum algicola]|jgi:DNA-binding transcriptional LysR family regulator|uniref:Transcriptional regulator, LysR family n=1 Tax=Marinovum algicola TaxID=42444 RepID=A0A975W6T3_9RHOB|nr:MULTISPECIES: LysR family transcriptional regulator [Marinovum]MDD9740062.1 LysR family transcriptional regulator [Marinovum sp. SP66]SEI64649.1 transcriptional regulator, LysR family [Marinovum algicola]SLN24863.1 HTH-type transcriptional activator CmpR [Marinovum algicola]